MTETITAEMTRHGAKRGNKRLGITKKGMNRMATSALLNGIKREDVSGNLRHYLDKLYFSHAKDADNIRVYNQNVFIFIETRLITVFDLPYKYRKTATFINKKKFKGRVFEDGDI